MEENKKNNTKVGIIAGIIVVGILALFSALSILGKSSMLSSQGMDGMNYETMPDDSYAEPKIAMEKSALDVTAGGSTALNFQEESVAPAPASTDKKIIKNGNLTMRVDNISDAQSKISGIANGNGGSVFSSNIYQSGKNVKSGMITVKIPVANFEKVLGEIKDIATLVIRETTSGRDVTEEYQDLEVQIKNKQAEEQSYVKILEQSGKISDVLEVTRQISRTRGEIERMQGRLRFMSSQTEMSTIDISLSEDQNVTVVDSWRPAQVAKDAVNSLVKSVQNFVDFVIVLVITFIPVAILYLVIILILFLIGRKIYRRFRKNKEN